MADLGVNGDDVRMTGTMVVGKMVMVIMEKTMGHLLVSLLLLIVQVYVFFQGFLRVNLELRFSTRC